MKELWTAMLDLRETWGRIPVECMSCRHQDTCGGGCKTHAFIKSGTFDARDPLCSHNRVPPTVMGL